MGDSIINLIRHGAPLPILRSGELSEVMAHHYVKGTTEPFDDYQSGSSGEIKKEFGNVVQNIMHTNRGQDTSSSPSKPSSETIKRTREEWLQKNPFLEEDEVQRLLDNPPLKPDYNKMSREERNWTHDSPM